MDQIHHDVHAITRHNPDQRKTVVLVAHSAFHHPSEDLQPTIQRQNIHMGGIPPLTIPGDLCIYIAACFSGVGAKKRVLIVWRDMWRESDVSYANWF